MKFGGKLDNIEKELINPENASDYEGLNRLYEEKVHLNDRMEEIFNTARRFEVDMTPAGMLSTSK